MLYFKGYRGESRKFALSYAHLINDAAGDGVRNVAQDRGLLQVLTDSHHH